MISAIANIEISYGKSLLKLTKYLVIQNPKYHSEKSKEGFYVRKVGIRFGGYVNDIVVVFVGLHMTLKDANQAAGKACIDYMKDKKDLKIIDINSDDLVDVQVEIS